MRGGWEPTSDDRGLGEFRGPWVTRNGYMSKDTWAGDPIRWKDIPGGFYEGRWTSLCDERSGRPRSIDPRFIWRTQAGRPSGAALFCIRWNILV